jgi:hypothetical protein
MRATAMGWIVTGALILGSSSCASENKTFGVTTAGPTKTSAPESTPVPVPAPQEPPARATTARVSVCKLFSTADVTGVLGLDVSAVEKTKEGPSTVCTWRAKERAETPAWRKEDPVATFEGGLVTVRQAPASAYGDLVRKVEDEANSQKAAGRQELSWIGNGAFAIGASVSGVPIWRAVALHGGLVTAVQVSGARSKSSVATVSDLLMSTIARSGDRAE